MGALTRALQKTEERNFILQDTIKSREVLPMAQCPKNRRTFSHLNMLSSAVNTLLVVSQHGSNWTLGVAIIHCWYYWLNQNWFVNYVALLLHKFLNLLISVVKVFSLSNHNHLNFYTLLGKKSNDKTLPAYVPSIFSFISSRRKRKARQSLGRYHSAKRRALIKEKQATAQLVEAAAQVEGVENEVTGSTSLGLQTDLTMVDIEQLELNSKEFLQDNASRQGEITELKLELVTRGYGNGYHIWKAT